MHDDPHDFDHSIRDGIFDGSADDIQDLFDDSDDHDDFAGFSRSRRRSGRQDLSRAPSWVKVLVCTGALLAIAGFGVLGFGFVTSLDTPDPFTPAFPATGFPTDAFPPGLPTDALPPGFPTDALPPGFPAADVPPDFPADALPPGFPVSAQPTTPAPGGPNLGLGFGLFFAGFVLSAIGALGHSTSRRR